MFRVSLFRCTSTFCGRVEYFKNDFPLLRQCLRKNMKYKKRKSSSCGMVVTLTFKTTLLRTAKVEINTIAPWVPQGRDVLAFFVFFSFRKMVTTDIFIFIWRRVCLFYLKTIRNYSSFKQLCAQCFQKKISKLKILLSSKRRMLPKNVQVKR